MNNILELWSSPWHALQRSLADSFDTPPTAARGIRRPRPNRGQHQPEADTWLIRARALADPLPRG